MIYKDSITNAIRFSEALVDMLLSNIDKDLNTENETETVIKFAGGVHAASQSLLNLSSPTALTREINYDIA